MDIAQKLKIDFIIVGAQKSGTSFLHQLLREHPQIYMPEDETPIFSDILYSNQKYIRRISYLLASHKKKIVGIKRPSFLYDHNVISRIKIHSPNAKLIVCLRDPSERAKSGYFHNMRMMLGPFINPNIGIPYLIKNKIFKDYPRSNTILEYGHYYKYLKIYLQSFPRNQLIIILYEDLYKNPIREIKKIYRFIGVNDSFLPGSINSFVMKGDYSMNSIYFQRIKSHFIYNKIDKSNPTVIPKNQNWIDRVFIELIDKIRTLVLPILGEADTKIEDKSNALLKKYYSKDIVILEKLIKRKLNHWR